MKRIHTSEYYRWYRWRKPLRIFPAASWWPFCPDPWLSSPVIINHRQKYIHVVKFSEKCSVVWKLIVYLMKDHPDNEGQALTKSFLSMKKTLELSCTRATRAVLAKLPLEDRTNCKARVDSLVNEGRVQETYIEWLLQIPSTLNDHCHSLWSRKYLGTREMLFSIFLIFPLFVEF